MLLFIVGKILCMWSYVPCHLFNLINFVFLPFHRSRTLYAGRQWRHQPAVIHPRARSGVVRACASCLRPEARCGDATCTRRRRTSVSTDWPGVGSLSNLLPRKTDVWIVTTSLTLRWSLDSFVVVSAVRRTSFDCLFAVSHLSRVLFRSMCIRFVQNLRFFPNFVLSRRQRRCDWVTLGLESLACTVANLGVHPNRGLWINPVLHMCMYRLHVTFCFYYDHCLHSR